MAQWIRYVYLMLILPWITQAQYYRGGSITTKPTADGMIEVSYQLFLDRNGHSCDSTTIGSEGAGGLLFCYGCSGPTVGLLNYRCVDFSVNGEWTMGRGVIEHNPGVMDFITLFTNGPTWVQPFDDIFYNLSTTVNLNRRGDTGVMNSSPVAHLIPDIHLAHGCDHYIQIPVTDPDDDIIKCRYALDATECGGGLCGVGTAGITLDEDSCTLKIDSTTIVPGLHAVTLMVEDFSPTDTTQPLSEVGLQFLIRALDPSFPCNTRPNFQSSDFYSDMCIGTFANTTLITKLTVNGLGPNSAMSEFHYVSTEDITVSELREGSDPSTALADLTWTPDEAVSNGKICFYATSSGGLPSPWFCVDLRTNGPEIQEQSLSWQQAELSSFKTLFSATFTTGIQRPKQEAHILFLDTLTGTPYYVIDVTSERGMSEVMYLDDGLLTIFPDYELYLPNATNISILLDAGVVLKDNCFIANADISDRNKWVFIKTGFCSTPEPNTCASEQTIETTTLPPSCNCPQGYSSSDATCICNDIDECTMSSGRICSDLCTNIPGSFLCACTQGFVISADSFNCTDVDECELYNGGCQHTCANTKGSYFCECSLGYTLHENQHSCKDIDECLVGSNNCSGLCINTESSYRCLCSMGYTLSSSNSNSCIDKDECKSYNGGCSHTCVNVDGSYRCECDEGFRLHPNQHFCIGEQTVNNITTNTTPSTCSCDLLMPFLTSSIILFLLFAWLAFYVIRNVLYLQQLNRGLSSFHQREYPEYRPPYGFKRPRPLWKPIGRVKRWPVRRTGTSRGRSQLTRF